MTTLPLSVSVIVPVLNCGDTIGDMLTALFNQAGVPDAVEVIVVDNGSADNTRDIVKHFNVTLLEEPKPGVSAARNRALGNARGDICVCIDGDTLPSRYWLREMLAPFSDPEVILVGGKVVSFRPETGAERYIENAGLYEPQNSVANPVFPFVVGMNLAVRRQAALAVGGWAEDLTRSEDIDFSYRIIQTFSTDIHYQPKAVIFHRNRRTDDGLKKQAFGYGYGAALIYKRYPDQFRWGWRQGVDVITLLCKRTLQAELMKISRLLGRASDESLSFAKYHRMWSWSFWKGFIATYYAVGDKGAGL